MLVGAAHDLDRAWVEEVVDVIIEAIEAEDPPFRMPVGEDAKQAVAMRRKLDDREWERLRVTT